MRASWYGHIEIVNFLVENGADINSQDYEYGYTSLIIASKCGHIEIVKHLIEKGVDINVTNLDGKTALILALENRHTDIVKLFKDASATK